MEDAPLPEHFADFAALSAAGAKRYPCVRHFLVWNEFKGFFDDELKRWDAKGYTDLYNVVYDAVKAVDRANQVGGRKPEQRLAPDTCRRRRLRNHYHRDEA